MDDMSIENESNSEEQSYTNDDYMIGISKVLPTLEQCYEFVAADPSCGACRIYVFWKINSGGGGGRK